MVSDNDTHFYSIEQLDTTQAKALTSEIISVYKDCWISTYPNSELGISKDDLLSKFSNIKDIENEWRSKILVSKDRSTWIVKNENNAIVGFCIARKGKESNELEYLYVLPDIQGKGYGRQLIIEALKWLGNSNSIYLLGASYNQKAIHFYQQFGFRLSSDYIHPKKLPNGKEIPAMKMIREKISKD